MAGVSEVGVAAGRAPEKENPSPGVGARLVEAPLGSAGVWESLGSSTPARATL